MLPLELTRLQAWGVLPPADLAAIPADAEYQDAVRWASAQPRPVQHELLAALPAMLPQLHPAKAAAVLVLAGGLVENGADPDLLLPAALRHLQQLRDAHEAGELVADSAWHYTVLGIMAMLTRSARNRARLRAQPELLAWLSEHEGVSDHFQYLRHMAEVSDEPALWVLFPTYGTGLEVSVAQVNNTFHLLTLLQPLVGAQAATLRLRRPPGPTAPAVLAYAQGRTHDPPTEPDTARLEWLTADAYAGPGQELHHASIAWGEAPVSSLPRLQGRVVLLADDPAQHIQRSWDAGFLTSVHDANRPAVELLRVLPAAEVQALLAELGTLLQVPAEVPAPPASATITASATATPTAPATPAVRPGFWQRLLGR